MYLYVRIWILEIIKKLCFNDWIVLTRHPKYSTKYSLFYYIITNVIITTNNYYISRMFCAMIPQQVWYLYVSTWKLFETKFYRNSWKIPNDQRGLYYSWYTVKLILIRITKLHSSSIQ